MKWGDLEPGDKYTDPKRGHWIVLKQAGGRVNLMYYPNPDRIGQEDRLTSTGAHYDVDLSNGKVLARAHILIEEDPL